METKIKENQENKQINNQKGQMSLISKGEINITEANEKLRTQIAETKAQQENAENERLKDQLKQIQQEQENIKLKQQLEQEKKVLETLKNNPTQAQEKNPLAPEKPKPWIYITQKNKAKWDKLTKEQRDAI